MVTEKEMELIFKIRQISKIEWVANRLQEVYPTTIPISAWSVVDLKGEL